MIHTITIDVPVDQELDYDALWSAVEANVPKKYGRLLD